eukprot:COSAG02_NODE_53429_length_302_cov_0.492611_1_plen_31_part_01
MCPAGTVRCALLGLGLGRMEEGEDEELAAAI